MRRPLVAGNWKMNGSKESVAALLQNLKGGCEHIEQAELAVLAPFVFLERCEQELMRTQVSWGAQNISSLSGGAYTGEVSASMLKDFNCRYVIVGHSERRTLYGESNEQVAAKCQAALAADICPIICVGETEEQRQADQTLAVVEEQLAAVLGFHNNGPSLTQAVVAYEPLWAIGTGKQATPEQAQAVHAAIRAQLAEKDAVLAEQVRVLYGGSVKPDNAADLFAMPDIDGALVGGASLQAETFFEIGRQCNSSS